MIRFVILLIMMLFTATAGATDYYVSPTGTETWPSCTTQNNPCLAGNTIEGRAFLDVEAGGTVIFLDGLYAGLTFDYNNYTFPAWYPTNTGTAGAKITFKALNNQLAILEGLTLVGDTCLGYYDHHSIPVAGANGSNYVVWDGFTVRAIDFNGVAIGSEINYFNGADYGEIINNNIIGAGNSDLGQCNYQSVRIEGSDHVTVRNNLLHGWGSQDVNHNTSALKTYDSDYLDISNNNFYDNEWNIYIKGRGHQNAKIYNNYITGGFNGILNTLNLTGADEVNHEYYNNVFNQVDNAFTDGGVGESYSVTAKFYNNTVYSPSLSSDSAGLIQFQRSLDGDNSIFYNNIIVNGDEIALATRETGRAMAQSDHNLIYPDFSVISGVWTGYTLYSTLSAWQASTELYAVVDVGCGSNQNPGCGSLNVDPLFTNDSGTFSNLEDFALDTGSPAIGAGRGGVDIGADVSLVGASVTAPTTGSTTTIYLLLNGSVPPYKYVAE